MVERGAAARSFGIVLGTLGRQGNPAILDHLERRMVTRIRRPRAQSPKLSTLIYSSYNPNPEP
jgi:hypothetical protein